MNLLHSRVRTGFPVNWMHLEADVEAIDLSREEGEEKEKVKHSLLELSACIYTHALQSFR